MPVLIIIKYKIVVFVIKMDFLLILSEASDFLHPLANSPVSGGSHGTAQIKLVLILICTHLPLYGHMRPAPVSSE